MNQNDCRNVKLSSRAVGTLILFSSLLLFAVGMIVIPLAGGLFAIPLLLLGIGMIAAPDSRACRLILNRGGRS